MISCQTWMLNLLTGSKDFIEIYKPELFENSYN